MRDGIKNFLLDVNELLAELTYGLCVYGLAMLVTLLAVIGIGAMGLAAYQLVTNLLQGHP